jgi:hypothetical protein
MGGLSREKKSLPATRNAFTEENSNEQQNRTHQQLFVVRGEEIIGSFLHWSMVSPGD